MEETLQARGVGFARAAGRVPTAAAAASRQSDRRSLAILCLCTGAEIREASFLPLSQRLSSWPQPSPRFSTCGPCSDSPSCVSRRHSVLLGWE